MSKSPPPQLVSRAAFSRLAGVSGAIVSRYCKPGGKLSGACVGDRVNVQHSDALAYLESRGVKAPKPPDEPQAPPKRGRGKSASSPERDPVLDGLDEEAHAQLDRVDPYASMTIRELVDRFGSRRAFKDWLEALVKIENVRKTRLANDESEGELISRELVQTHVFGALEGLHQRLLVDMPRTMAARLYAAAQSGESREEGERIARDLISSQLRTAKTRSARVLRDA